MTETPNLAMSEMEQSQAQKHVTFNLALNRLDALMFLSVIDRNLATPPGSPAEGDRYIVASGGTGDWLAADDNIAIYQSGAWVLMPPQEGWVAYVDDENASIRWDGAAWVADGSTGIILSNQTVLSESANTAQTGINTIEELLSGLTGATAVSTIALPADCIVLGVSTRVTTLITGATSFDCGDGTTAGRFGSTLAVAANSVEQGLVSPAVNATSTTITLTANGGNFTAGAVRVCLHYIATQPPQS